MLPPGSVLDPGRRPQSGRSLPLLNVGRQECRETAVGNTAHLVSPRRRISSERGNNTESEASCSAGRLIAGHRRCPLDSFRVDCACSCPPIDCRAGPSSSATHEARPRGASHRRAYGRTHSDPLGISALIRSRSASTSSSRSAPRPSTKSWSRSRCGVSARSRPSLPAPTCSTACAPSPTSSKRWRSASKEKARQPRRREGPKGRQPRRREGTKMSCLGRDAAPLSAP